MTVSNNNFKGMEYYEISFEWKKPDDSKGYGTNKTVSIIPN